MSSLYTMIRRTRSASFVSHQLTQTTQPPSLESTQRTRLPQHTLTQTNATATTKQTCACSAPRPQHGMFTTQPCRNYCAGTQTHMHIAWHNRAHTWNTSLTCLFQQPWPARRPRDPLLEHLWFLCVNLVVWVPLNHNSLKLLVLLHIGGLGSSDSYLIRTHRFFFDLVVLAPLIHHSFELLVLLRRFLV